MMPLLVQNIISFLKSLISLQRIDALLFLSIFTKEKRKCTCRSSVLCTSLWITMISDPMKSRWLKQLCDVRKSPAYRLASINKTNKNVIGIFYSAYAFNSNALNEYRVSFTFSYESWNTHCSVSVDLFYFIKGIIKKKEKS